MPESNPGPTPQTKDRSYLAVIVLILGDLVSFGLAILIAVGIRYLLIPRMGGVIPWRFLPTLIFFCLIIGVLTFAFSGLYPGFGRTAVAEMQQIFASTTLAFGILVLAVYIQKTSVSFPRTVFVLGWFLSCVIILALRLTIRNRFSLFSWWSTPIVVVGPVSEAQDIIQKLGNSRRLGLKPVLVFDESPAGNDSSCLGVPVIHSFEQLERLLPSSKTVFAVYIGLLNEIRGDRLHWLSENFQNVLVILDNSPLGSLWVRTIDLEGRLILHTQYHILDRTSVFVKRLVDIVVSALMLVVSSPLLLLVSILIKLDTPGPVVFSQERLGVRGKSFRCYKFRTMKSNAEEQLSDLFDRDPQAYAEYQKHHKLSQDPRITRMGRWLRRYSLDEFPQLYNVLRGEVSMVGPRAYLPAELEEMGDKSKIILRIRPGLTGWWQVMGRHMTTFAQRLQLDEYYLSNWSLWLDLYIMIKTGWIIISGKGA